MSATLRDVLLKLTKPMSLEDARAYIAAKHGREMRDSVGSDRTALDAVALARLDAMTEIAAGGAPLRAAKPAIRSLAEVRGKIKEIRDSNGRSAVKQQNLKVKLRSKFRSKI